MNPTVEGLIELQRIDDEIRTFRKQRQELAANLERLRAIVVQMNASLEVKRARLRDSERWYEDKRTDLLADQDRISQSKSKMGAVQRSKEYAAVTKELDTLRSKVSGSERELEQLQQALTDARQNVALEETKLAEIQAEVQREESLSADRLGALDAEIAGIESKKDVITDKLPKNIVATYRRILPKRDGIAVVPAVKGACMGCRMLAPPPVWQKIQIGREIFQCSNCNRFLYYSVEASQEAMRDS